MGSSDTALCHLIVCAVLWGTHSAGALWGWSDYWEPKEREREQCSGEEGDGLTPSWCGEDVADWRHVMAVWEGPASCWSPLRLVITHSNPHMEYGLCQVLGFQYIFLSYSKLFLILLL